jgi:putative Holliday junction resolvase
MVLADSPELESPAKSKQDRDTMENMGAFCAPSRQSGCFRNVGVSSMTRILGLDYGTRRIGASLSDPGRTIAFPLELYESRGPVADARHYGELVHENDVERIVVGLPLHTSGREGELSSRARTFGNWLAGVTGRPVFYYDERYTTVEAEQRLIDAGLTRHKRKALRDKLAAQIMLQSYLDAGCPEQHAAPAPLADPDEVET